MTTPALHRGKLRPREVRGPKSMRLGPAFLPPVLPRDLLDQETLNAPNRSQPL